MTKKSNAITPATSTTPVVSASKSSVDINDIKVGDLFSEASHYIVKDIHDSAITFTHIENNSDVVLTKKYVQSLLTTANQYTTLVRVGREDKLWTDKQIQEAIRKGELPTDTTVRVGDVRQEGIRTIWENIHDTRVFTVCFVTQGKDLPKKEYERLLGEQAQQAITDIDNAAKGKRGVANIARKVIEAIQQNPVSKFEEGKDRILKGWKQQFVSRDGRYNCIDVEIKDVHNIRPVNINTIKWLVVDGVKYEVE